jgi:hypothetical protein
MKALRALMLVLTLSVCAYAGDMDNGRSPDPTPTPDPTGNTTAPAGDEPTAATGDAPAEEPSSTEVTLSVLESILSLF